MKKYVIALMVVVAGGLMVSAAHACPWNDYCDCTNVDRYRNVQKFADGSEDMRRELFNKEAEFEALMESDKYDAKRVTELSKEIYTLRMQLRKGRKNGSHRFSQWNIAENGWYLSYRFIFQKSDRMDRCATSGKDTLLRLSSTKIPPRPF